MRHISPIQRMEQTALAVRLIKLDARLQLLEAELCLSRGILLIMYREIRGESPPKGMLPFADEWYFTWQPCIHSSLFMAYHQFYESSRELSPLECLIRAYEKYIQEISRRRNYIEGGPVVSITRAWMMLKKMSGRGRSLQLTTCIQCGGDFVTSVGLPSKSFVCSLCHLPARAGKTNRANGRYL